MRISVAGGTGTARPHVRAAAGRADHGAAGRRECRGHPARRAATRRRRPDPRPHVRGMADRRGRDGAADLSPAPLTHQSQQIGANSARFGSPGRGQDASDLRQWIDRNRLSLSMLGAACLDGRHDLHHTRPTPCSRGRTPTVQRLSLSLQFVPRCQPPARRRVDPVGQRQSVDLIEYLGGCKRSRTYLLKPSSQVGGLAGEEQVPGTVIRHAV